MKRLIIEKQKVASNLALTRERAGDAQICGVLKNDAYGLGLVPMARLMRDEGVRRFAVGEPEEAALLRREGFTDEEILLLRSTADPNEIESLLDLSVIATVGSQEAAMALSGIAERRGTVAEAHIKIDSGFGRYGFLPSEADRIFSVVRYMHSIAVSGFYTHISKSVSSKELEHRLAAFDGLLDGLRAQGVETGTVHALSSSLLFKFNGLPRYDMVRAGASMGGRLGGKYGLKRVGAACSEITEVRWMPAGSAVSQGKRLKKSVRIGIAPIGHADGIGVERAPGSRFEYLAGLLRPSLRTSFVRLESGDSVKILGRPGQNHIALDITRCEAGIGSLVYADVNPLYSARLPKSFV